MQKTLAIDLGSTIGFVISSAGTVLRSGSLELATVAELEQQRREGRERTGDIRFRRLYQFLEETIKEDLERIVFEDVEFVKSQMQGQLWPSLRSAIWAADMSHPGLAIHCVSSVTLKHFATGNGRAPKESMAQALVRRYPELYQMAGTESVSKTGGTLADHNEVDAIWLAHYVEAVDRGERRFIGAYQRKKEKTVVRRQRQAEQRLVAKSRRAEAEAKRKRLEQAIRSLGRCCGAYRVQRNRWAVCLRCGSSQPLPHPPSTDNPSF